MAVPAQTYAVLSETLSRAGIVGDSAEVHGGLCAGLCVEGIAGARAWAEDWLADAASGAGDLGELSELLIDLGKDAWRALNDADFGFELVLPDDDEPLALRVRALASWCHGFVEAVGLGGVNSYELPDAGRDDLDEIIADFIEISHAAAEEPASADTDFQLTELIEFVRVGAQTVFELLGPRREQRTHQSLH